MKNKKNNTIILHFIFYVIFFTGGIFHLSVQAQQKCNTFKTIDYNFHLLKDTKEDNDIISFHKVLTDRRSSPPNQQHYKLELKEDTGFLSAYAITIHLIQQAHKNKKKSKIKRSEHPELIKKISKYIKKLENNIKQLKTVTPKNEKFTQHHNDINKLLQSIKKILQTLKDKNISTRTLDRAFESIIHFTGNVESAVAGQKTKNGIGIYVSIRKDNKDQWSQKKPIKDLGILPPLFISGKRKTKFLCDRKAEDIKVHIKFNKDSENTHSKTQEEKNENN